jgi:hypothetical protein
MVRLQRQVETLSADGDTHTLYLIEEFSRDANGVETSVGEGTWMNARGRYVVATGPGEYIVEGTGVVLRERG